MRGRFNVVCAALTTQSSGQTSCYRDMACDLAGEPELVREVERFWLVIVGLSSRHSMGSGIAQRERRWDGVGLLIALQLW